MFLMNSTHERKCYIIWKFFIFILLLLLTLLLLTSLVNASNLQNVKICAESFKDRFIVNFSMDFILSNYLKETFLGIHLKLKYTYVINSNFITEWILFLLYTSTFKYQQNMDVSALFVPTLTSNLGINGAYNIHISFLLKSHWRNIWKKKLRICKYICMPAGWHIFTENGTCFSYVYAINY